MILSVLIVLAAITALQTAIILLVVICKYRGKKSTLRGAQANKESAVKVSSGDLEDDELYEIVESGKKGTASKHEQVKRPPRGGNRESHPKKSNPYTQ